MIHELTQKIIEDLMQKKDHLVKDRIKELGLNLEYYEDLLKNKKVRFNPFIHEHHENGYEFLYFNDGTENGLFIIGFKNPTIEDNMSTVNYDFEPKISASINYFTVEPEWNKIKNREKF
jgi:hypothetical protein